MVTPTIAPTNNETDAIMQLNEYGQIAYNEWLKLSERFSNVELDVFQIMPNHIHGIIILNDVGAGFTPALNENGQPTGKKEGQPQGIAPTGTIGNIVGAYKSLVANRCLAIHKQKWMDVNPEWAGVNHAPTMGKIWQRNYYEHIIRNEQSYQTISEYIINNPTKWKTDKFYIE